MNVEVKTVKLSAIKLNPDNPRQISTKDMDLLVKSLTEFPEMMSIREIVVDENMVALGGNMRTLALRKAGAKTCIAKIVKGWTDEQKRRFVISDNGSWGAWDMDALANAWGDLPLADWGVDLPEDWLAGGGGAEPQDAEPQIDRAEELNKTWRVKSGDLWLIGDHRLLCGDSTKKEDVGRVMGGERADIALTDPPYGINLLGKSNKVGGNGTMGLSKEYRPVLNDETVDVAREHLRIIKDVADNLIIFGGNYFTDFLPPTRCWLIWDKKRPVELTFCGIELAWTSYDQHPRLYEWLWDGGKRKGDRTIELATRVHPTQKPVGMLCNILKDFAGKVILDGFMGSGSTMVACEQNDRVCRGIEVDPAYCAVILQRMTDAFPGIEIRRGK